MRQYPICADRKRRASSQTIGLGADQGAAYMPAKENSAGTALKIMLREQLVHWKWLVQVTDADIERFNLKWDIVNPSKLMEPADGPCHLWNAGVSKGGQSGSEKLPYGSFWVCGTTVRAHIFAALVLGTYNDVPHMPGLHVDHRCRVTLCVAPLHLEPCPIEENANRWRK